MILFAILLYLFFPEVFSLSSILKIIVISLIWDIFWAAIRVKNKSFNREVKRHIDKQYEKFFFELAHPNDEVIIDKEDEKIESQRIITNCVKCGKEFPAVTYGISKSNYGVGVPESMKDHQNGDLEFYEKNKCDDCMLEEQAKEDEVFENMIEECIKHGCQENCGDKYKEENEKLIETQKWNPAQEILIEYIKECELTVFEAEKVHDFIRNEIKVKRYKGGNT